MIIKLKIKIKKPTEEDIINAIENKWFNDNFISKDLIIKSFKITGISSNLDGLENSIIKHNEEIRKEIIIPNDILLEDINFSDSENEIKSIKTKKDDERKIIDYFGISFEMDIEK